MRSSTILVLGQTRDKPAHVSQELRARGGALLHGAACPVSILHPYDYRETWVSSFETSTPTTVIVPLSLWTLLLPIPLPPDAGPKVVFPPERVMMLMTRGALAQSNSAFRPHCRRQLIAVLQIPREKACFPSACKLS